MAPTPKEFFLDPEFLNSPEARSLRILAEYFGPRQRFKELNILHTVVLMGSARVLSAEEARKNLAAAITDIEKKRAQRQYEMSHYYEDARQIAKDLSLWSQATFPKDQQLFICTGGGPGIMEAGNRGATEAGNKSIGLNILLPHEQGSNHYIDPNYSFTFRYFFMRKLWFLYFAKGLIFFPGGLGTLDEMAETLTLLQTKKITKKIPLLLYGKNFWQHFIRLDYLAEMGLIAPEDLDLVQYVDSVPEALEILKPALDEAVRNFNKTLFYNF